MENAAHTPKYPVQTLEKALAVLLFLRNSDSKHGLSITEISAGLGMPKSGVHRILDTFLAYDFVQKNRDNQCYRLGWGLYFAGNGIPSQYSITSIDYRSVMQRVCDALLETVNIGIFNENEVVIICTIEPNRRLRPTVGVGEREPIYATALGKVFMSAFSDEVITEIMTMNTPEKLTQNTITDAAEMIREVARVREDGYGMDREEFCEGLTCMSMPIRDYSGRIVAALSVSSVTSRMNDEKTAEIIMELHKASAELSAMLGYKE